MQDKEFKREANFMRVNSGILCYNSHILGKKEDFMTSIQNKAALPKDLKKKNQRKILNVLQNSSREDWSLAELSEHTGISRATVAKAVTYFVEKDILLYKGKGSSTDIGGKKPDVYAFNPEYRFVAYLNIGIGMLSMSFLDLKLRERGAVTIDFPISSDVDEMIQTSKQCYETLLHNTTIPKDGIHGLCISTSGMVNQQSGILQCNLAYPYWGNEIPLKEKFEQAFPDLVILVENVARAAGRAELYYNEAFQDKKVFTVFTFRGISGCLIDHGKIQNSHNSLIGEIGHMIICPDDSELCRCNSRGCFEQMVSEERMLKRMHQEPERLNTSILGEINEIRLGHILEAANQGDEYACTLTEEAARYFAMALRNIILTIDPDIIVIQGRYASGGPYFLDKIKEHLYNQTYFPKTSDWLFLYDERDTWSLVEVGLAATMADELLQDL